MNSKNKIKITYFVLSGLVLVTCLGILFNFSDFFNPNNEKDTPVTKIHFVDNISTAHQALIDRFNAEYRGKIELIPVDLPFSRFNTNERKQLLAKLLRSKNDQIDIFAVDLVWVSRFARWGHPLAEDFSVSESSQMIEYALESCYYDGELIAIPFYIDIGMMYYRRDLLKLFPDHEALGEKLKRSITWEEFIELSKRYPRQDHPFYLFPAKNFEGLICCFVENLMEENQLMFSADSIRLNTPEARNALALLVELVHKHNMTPLVATRFDDEHNYQFALKSDALFFRGWPGLMRNYKSISDKDKLKYLEEAALPHFEGYSPVSVFGGWNLMVSKFSTKKQTAIEFIKFVLRAESQKLMFEEGGYIPVNRAVYEDSVFLASNPNLIYYRQLLQNGIHRPYAENYTKISDIISYYLNLAIKKEITVVEALDRATREVNSQKSVIR